MPVDVLLHINPPVALGVRWWALCAGLALLAVAVLVAGILRWRFLGHSHTGNPDTSMATLRAEALGRIAATTSAFHAGNLKAQSACQAISRATRQFAGTASDGDADFETAAQISTAARREPRLHALASFVTSIQDDCFSPDAAPDVDGVADSARDVIQQWR